ncbi:MAG: alpha/beta hydrolase [Planctomycetota bacterium]|jgi:acetyl esterase/lipase
MSTAFTTDPTPPITAYLPVEKGRTNLAVVIFPGGGYGHLAEHEGKGYAAYLQGHGIAAFVVEYRLGTQGHRHPAMLEDALYAVQYVRERAEEFGVSPSAVGVMGSSAGGHLAAHSLTGWKDYGDGRDLRPDFGILCYPVIDMLGEYAHVGSRTNLLGEGASEVIFSTVSPDRLVDGDTPPAFLWHTGEDEGVPPENSLLFTMAMRKHKRPVELRLYHGGGHGLGLDTEHPWGRDCVAWLKGRSWA